MRNKLYYLDESEKTRILGLHENYKKGVINELNDDSLAAPKTEKDFQTPKRKPESNAGSLMQAIGLEKGKVSAFFDKILKNPDPYGLPQKTLDSITDWLKYPCIINSLNVTPVLLSDNTFKFESKGHNWFAGGRSYDTASRQMGDYHCGADGKVAEGLPEQQPVTSDVGGSTDVGSYENDGTEQSSNTGAQQSSNAGTQQSSNAGTQQSSNVGAQQAVNIRADYRVLTPQKIAELRKKIGSTSTGNQLTQDDLNKIMEKIKQK